jgi:hypothetical protein
MKAKIHIISGEAHMTAIAVGLIKASVWFQVTPLPDDMWQIETKDESATTAQIEALIKIVTAPVPEPITIRELPEDVDGRNGERAQLGANALLQFQMATRCDQENALPDLLANLMHFEDRRGPCLDDALNEARDHYVFETGQV